MTTNCLGYAIRKLIVNLCAVMLGITSSMVMYKMCVGFVGYKAAVLG